jgi:hypothetical protein
VIFLSFVPQLFEATTLALLGLWAFKFPIEVSFTFGFTIATVAAAIVVPSLMKWNDQGYGRSKGMVASLIAACTFDNIICLILFGICKTVAFEHAAERKHLVSKNSNVAWSIGKIFVHNLAGVGLGLVLGSFGWALKLIKHKMIGLWIKCIYCVISAIIIVVAAELSHYTNGKYIACLTLGYTCFRIWGVTNLLYRYLRFGFYSNQYYLVVLGRLSCSLRLDRETLGMPSYVFLADK